MRTVSAHRSVRLNSWGLPRTLYPAGRLCLLSLFLYGLTRLGETYSLFSSEPSAAVERHPTRCVSSCLSRILPAFPRTPSSLAASLKMDRLYFPLPLFFFRLRFHPPRLSRRLLFAAAAYSKTARASLLPPSDDPVIPSFFHGKAGWSDRPPPIFIDESSCRDYQESPFSSPCV